MIHASCSVKQDPEHKRECQKKLAATYIRLADNSCERILIDPAVELYQQALQLRTALKLSPTLVAETNICIGNAYTYKEQYATAKTFFLIAKDTLADATDATEMLADLEGKIGMCSVGNLNIVPDAADADADTGDAGATTHEAAAPAAPTTRKREEIEAKIASATVVQVCPCACVSRRRCVLSLLPMCLPLLQVRKKVRVS